jgi:hypothetical protein
MTAPVSTQILAAYQALLLAAATGAGASVHVDRTAETPFEPAELPAVNLLLVDEDIDQPAPFGAARGQPVLQVHALRIVREVYTRGGPAAAAQARLIDAQCDAATAADPTLDGKCSQLLLPKKRQHERDDASEQKLFSTKTLLVGEYRTYSNAPFTAV